MTEVEWYVVSYGTVLTLLALSVLSTRIPPKNGLRGIGRLIRLVLCFAIALAMTVPFFVAWRSPGLHHVTHLIVFTVVSAVVIRVYCYGRKTDWGRGWKFAVAPSTETAEGVRCEMAPSFDVAQYRRSRSWRCGLALNFVGLALAACAAWFLLGVAMLVIVPLMGVAPTVLGLLLGVGATWVAPQIYDAGRDMRLQERRNLSRVIDSPEDLSPGSYVLYLRTFSSDRLRSRLELVGVPNFGESFYRMMLPEATEEEDLVGAVRPVGQLVAVGIPGEDVPHAGAIRMYLPKSDWQQPVSLLIKHARLVVIQLGASPGTVWEVAEAMSLVAPQRLVLLVPAELSDLEYEEVRRKVKRELRGMATGRSVRQRSRARRPGIPSRPKGKSGAITRGIGFIRFSDGWVPHMEVQDYLYANPGASYFLALTKGMRPVFEELEVYEERVASS